MDEFVFNVLTTFKLMWKRGQGLESHLHVTDRISRESNSGPLSTCTWRVVYPLYQDGSSCFAYLHCCLLFLLLIVGVSVFGPCFVNQYLMSFSCCYHLGVDERAGCATLNVYLMSCDCQCSVALPYGTVGWSAVFDSGIY